MASGCLIQIFKCILKNNTNAREMSAMYYKNGQGRTMQKNDVPDSPLLCLA